MDKIKETALATTEEPQQALQVGEYNFTAEQVALIKRTIAMGCTDDELKLFVHVCRRLKLDPIAKQIYAVKMDGKMVMQTGIDGFRLLAERTGRYRGTSDPEWCGPDGVWKEVWTDRAEVPSAARVRVMRQGPDDLEPVVISGIANFWEYVALKDGKPNRRWTQAPAAMIAKCAEALALRRAVPNELSGLFTFDETAGTLEKQADAPKVALPTRKSDKPKAVAAKPAQAAPARLNALPSDNPWTGDIDDIKPSPDGDWWKLTGDQGTINFSPTRPTSKTKRQPR